MWTEVEWIASTLGIAGAVTNSVGGRLLRMTWPLWFLSNVLDIVVLWRLQAYGLMTQQMCYLATTLVGGFRAFWPEQWCRVCTTISERTRTAIRWART
ncbi:hypothetical protein [Ralstonia sp. ASV6]|uniref:hypothetical protein n=1 Tax=Ralstonia sp. ASV6 TaxID=2795124 RepID=UPI0018EC6D6E|nr:hypothetical protein [Ralstonia sp. ASV6]